MSSRHGQIKESELTAPRELGQSWMGGAARLLCSHPFSLQHLTAPQAAFMLLLQALLKRSLGRGGDRGGDGVSTARLPYTLCCPGLQGQAGKCQTSSFRPSRPPSTWLILFLQTYAKKPRSFKKQKQPNHPSLRYKCPVTLLIVTETWKQWNCPAPWGLVKYWSYMSQME